MTKQNVSRKPHEQEAAIDWSVFEMLRGLRKQDDPAPGTRLINLFISSSPALLDSMQAAIQAASPEALANAAHSMKSGSLNMGATRLGELCAQLEKIGRGGSTAEASDVFAKIELEYAAVEAAFRKALAKQ